MFKYLLNEGMAEPGSLASGCGREKLQENQKWHGAEISQIGSGVEYETDSAEYSSKEKKIWMKVRWRLLRRGEPSNSWAERVGLEGWQLPLSPAFYAGNPRTMPWSWQPPSEEEVQSAEKLLGSSHQPGREASQGILEKTLTNDSCPCPLLPTPVPSIQLWFWWFLFHLSTFTDTHKHYFHL